MKKIILLLIIFSSTILWAHQSEPVQLFPTVLKVTVLNDLGNPVEGATVTLYNNETDYFERENPAYDSLQTDEKGEVKFKKINPKTYYIDVEKENLSNAGGGIQTQDLEKGKVNQIRVIIE